jgi:hypothetical protein
MPTSTFLNTASPHAVQFYEEDDALIERLAEFAGSALGGGDACVVVATPDHRRELALRLLRQGLNVERMLEEGRFQMLDAAATLKLFMVNGEPVQTLFVAAVEEVLSKADSALSGSWRRRAIFGEMVALLWADGKPRAAIRLEEMWNDLAKKHSFSLLCAYPIWAFGEEKDQQSFRRLCAEHTHVMPCESYGKLWDESRKLQKVCELQQESVMLKTEILRRKKAEASLRRQEVFIRDVN